MLERILKAVALALLATALLSACEQDNGSLYPESGEVLHFGDVLLGTAAYKPVHYREQIGESVRVADLVISGPNVALFDHDQPTFPINVAALGDMHLTLSFSPVDVGRFSAMLNPASSSTGTQTPVSIRGNGVFQIEDVFIKLDDNLHPSNMPLDFGDVEVGNYLDLPFRVSNDKATPVTLTLDVRSDSGSFNVPGPTVQLNLPPRTAGSLDIRFSPSAIGEFTGTATYTSATGTSTAIVLSGRGVSSPAVIDGVTLVPQVVVPGETITLTYTISHPVNFGDVSGVQLFGLPDNVSSGPMPLPMPSGNGGSVTHTITLGPPARDGVFPLRLAVAQASGGTVYHLAGNLTVQDVPATVSNVAIQTPEHHRSMCELPIVDRQLDYDVSDENGAADIYNARIDEILPPENSEPLMAAPYPTLALPGNWNSVTESVNTPLSIICAARVQGWTLRTMYSEDDKVTGNMMDRITEDVGYTVRP